MKEWLGQYYGDMEGLPKIETNVYQDIHSEHHVNSMIHLYKVMLKSLHDMDKQSTDKIGYWIKNNISDSEDPTECYQVICGHALENDFSTAYYEIKRAFEKIVRRAYENCFDDMVIWLISFQKQEEENRKNMIENVKNKRGFVL